MSGISNLELRQFVVVAEELHFRRAASRLGMTQPPLSQAMQRLEREIGVELFDHSQRRVRLTEAGTAFLGEARRTLAQARRAVEGARRAAQGLVGSLRVTYVGAAAYDFLPKLLRAYRAGHPEVEVQLVERPTARQARSLQLGEADAGFVRPPVFDAEDLLCEPVLREALILATPQDHWAAGREEVDPGALAKEDLVMFPAHEGPSFHARIVTACESAGFSLRVAQEAVQMHAIVSLVAAGLGIALVPASMRNVLQVGVVYWPLRTSSGPSRSISPSCGGAASPPPS